jgi:hypothetical protein
LFDAKSGLELTELRLENLARDAMMAEVETLERFVSDFVRQAEAYARVEATALWLARGRLPKHLESAVSHAVQNREKAEPSPQWLAVLERLRADADTPLP